MGGVLLNAVRPATCTAALFRGSSTLFRAVITYSLVKLCLLLLPQPRRWKECIPLKCRWTYTVLHCVISQKAVAFMDVYLDTMQQDARIFLLWGEVLCPRHVIRCICLIPWSEVRLRLLSTSANNWPIVTAPDDRRIWRIWCNENRDGKPKFWRKPSPMPVCLPQISCDLT
jgi:hypothetical protein